VARAEDHRIVIERRGRAHKAVCSCSWAGHAWNELRPAESDAWHHIYGDSAVVDVSAVPDERNLPADPASRSGVAVTGPAEPQDAAIEQLVRDACALAARPSPYTKGAAPELWQRAAGDRLLVHAAINQLVEMLSRHDRVSAGAADSEWLTLITAKRLLSDSLACGELQRAGP
jgi:hypothetical protein